MRYKKPAFLAGALVCILFCFVMACFAAKQNNLDHFKKNIGAEIVFLDVNDTDWFSPYIKTVSQMGLMVGQSNTRFNPAGNITLAETYTIAARLHSIYHNGHENFRQTGVWYQVYLDYAKASHIHSIHTTNYNRPATRAEFAQVLASAFPSEALAEINSISDTAIPDVTLQKPYGKSVYTLYRAGVLTGNDAAGTFSPNSNIKRSEVAAIVSRMADPESRIILDALPSIDVSNEGKNETTDSEVKEPAITEPAFCVQTVTAEAGARRVAVTISVKNNPGISALALNLSHDSGIKLTDVVYNDQLPGETMLPQTIKNPVKLIWLNPFEDVKNDFVLATVYFDVSDSTSKGDHQISITYNPDDVFDLSENNVYFETVQGAIIVTK